jgi:uncharacterized membrane protein YuzA (DUF378 family)
MRLLMSSTDSSGFARCGHSCAYWWLLDRSENSDAQDRIPDGHGLRRVQGAEQTVSVVLQENLDPLQYLNRVERLLLGWMVVRQFRVRYGRFPKWLRSSGPEAVARTSCARVLTLYIWVTGMSAAIFHIAEINVIANILYVLTGVCAVWAVACILSSLEPQREFRRTRQDR